MIVSEFLAAADKLAALELTVSPVCRTEELSAEDAQALLARNAAVETGSIAVAEVCAEVGFDPARVALHIASHTDTELAGVFGKCRYLAETRADITQIDRVAEGLVKTGYLEMVNFRLSPTGTNENCFTASNIPQFSRWIRFSKALAVRGIFVSDVTEAERAKEMFSLIKKIRSDMPCLFSFLCFDGLLAPLAAGDAAVIDAVRMLASLNDTSLYATFFVQ